MKTALEGRVFVDFHCHSEASFDSLSPAARVVSAAVDRGLTHLAVTDHERIDGALRARDLARDSLTVIVGEEVRSIDGDVIGLYLERPVPPGLSALETIAAIHDQGGLAGIPHPFDRFRASGLARLGDAALEEVAKQVDYVEAFNARVPYPAANQRAAEFARRFQLPGVAASDAHSVVEIGISYTVLAGPVDDAVALRRALQDVELVVGPASVVARGAMPIVKLIQRMRGNRRICSACRRRPGA